MLINEIDVEGDLPLVEQVVKKAFEETPDSDTSDWFSFDEMKKSILDGRGVCLKVVADGEMLGVVHAQQENPINGREGVEKWVVTSMAVVPEMTGKGLGSKLMIELEKTLKNKGVKKVFVHTNLGDDRVINFYKKNGYKDAGQIKDYYYDGSAVFLIKYL